MCNPVSGLKKAGEPDQKMKTVWIISEGSPGHVSQSQGLADALSDALPLQAVLVRGRATVRGWLRPLVRWLMGSSNGRRTLPDWILRRVTSIKIPSDSPKPNLIVSSGGKSVFAARTLANRYNVPYVFIGERKPFPAEWFHTIISPAPAESSANSIDVELIPTPVTPAFIAEKGDEEKGGWCMIIGGSSRSHHFKETDWIGLAEGMNALAEREQICWLLTTSRRTGAETEAVLKKYLNPDILKDAIWWAEQPRKELYSFMARSELLFVTQDSVTMVTEAVSAGKPVVVVHPEEVVFPEDSFMQTYLNRLESNGRIARLKAGQLPDIDYRNLKFKPLRGSILEPVSKELCRRINWSV